MSTNTVVLRSIKGLSNLCIKFLVTFLFCELLLRCNDILEELRCSNTTSIYIIQALHCIWLRNWYGNSLTTTQLIYGPLELFCMLNLIDCTLELFIAKLVGLDAMLVVFWIFFIWTVTWFKKFSNLIDCLHSIPYFSLLWVLTLIQLHLGWKRGMKHPYFVLHWPKGDIFNHTRALGSSKHLFFFG